MYVTFKDKGIDYAKQAVEADERGDISKALNLYQSSLEYFKTYLKYEKNPRSVEAIKAKVCGRQNSRCSTPELGVGHLPVCSAHHILSLERWS